MMMIWIMYWDHIQVYLKIFSKFYAKVGAISWLLFHLIWKNYVLNWDFVMKSWIVDFFTPFIQKKHRKNNFSWQTFSIDNNYFFFALLSCSASHSIWEFYRTCFSLKRQACFWIITIYVVGCFRHYLMGWKNM